MVTLKVAQKWKRVLEGRRAAGRDDEKGMPAVAREPLAHRSATKNRSTQSVTE